MKPRNERLRATALRILFALGFVAVVFASSWILSDMEAQAYFRNLVREYPVGSLGLGLNERLYADNPGLHSSTERVCAGPNISRCANTLFAARYAGGIPNVCERLLVANIGFLGVHISSWHLRHGTWCLGRTPIIEAAIRSAWPRRSDLENSRIQ